MRWGACLSAALLASCSGEAADPPLVEETAIAGSDTSVEAKAALVARFDIPACNEARLQTTERLSAPGEAGGARIFTVDEACVSALRDTLAEEGFAPEPGSTYRFTNTNGWTETVRIGPADGLAMGTIVWETTAP